MLGATHESEGKQNPALSEEQFDEAREAIISEHPSLERLPEELLKSLAKAEHSWRRIEAFERFDFGVIIVSFAKAVEHLLKRVVPNCPSNMPLGKIISHIENMHGWTELRWSLRQMSRLRGGPDGAHYGQPSKGKEDLLRARYLAFKIFNESEAL